MESKECECVKGKSLLTCASLVWFFKLSEKNVLCCFHRLFYTSVLSIQESKMDTSPNFGQIFTSLRISFLKTFF